MAESPALRLAERLRAAGATRVEVAAPLAALTTLKVGGPARVLVRAEDDADLAAAAAIGRSDGLGWLVVGKGSNLLVHDDGFPGIAVVLGRGFRGVERIGTSVVAGAAEPLPALATRLARDGLGGFAWGAGVPGTLGGAVRMNAGAHGGEMADHLRSVTVFRLASGTREEWPAAVLELGYRRSNLPADAVVVAATLDLEATDPDEASAAVRDVRTWRREHQPINEPNCGSVFTNPPGDSAGRLVEVAGAKGWRLGGAEVSRTHANFIVTRPGATAHDVHRLIRAVRWQVRSRSGVTLAPEVRTVGGFPALDDVEDLVDVELEGFGLARPDRGHPGPRQADRSGAGRDGPGRGGPAAAGAGTVGSTEFGTGEGE